MHNTSLDISILYRRGLFLTLAILVAVGGLSCGRSSRSSTVSGVTGDSIFAADVPKETEEAKAAREAKERSAAAAKEAPSEPVVRGPEDPAVLTAPPTGAPTEAGSDPTAASPGLSKGTSSDDGDADRQPDIVRTDQDEIPRGPVRPDSGPGRSGGEAIADSLTAANQDSLALEFRDPGSVPPADSLLGTRIDSLRASDTLVTADSLATADTLGTADSLGTAARDSLELSEPEFVIPQNVGGEVNYRSAPRTPSDFGLWSTRPGAEPSHDAFLFRMAERARAHETLKRGSFLGGEQSTRLDTLVFRQMAPDFLEMKVTERLSHPVDVDLDLGRVELSHRFEGTPVDAPVTVEIDEYLDRLTSQTIYTVWADVRSKGVQTEGRRQRGSVNLTLPVDLGSGVLGSVFGKGQPNLSVTGSERITFRGRSQWNPNQLADEARGRQSKFPQLNMEQQLNLRLTGTIGDKVTVDVDQSSESTTPLANRIKIFYKGYEDEILQRVDLGNTSLRLPGTRYVTFSGRTEGLFGINALAKVGDVDFNMILTKQEGRNDSKSVTRTAERQTITIEDYKFIGSKYFFLLDPDDCPWQLDEGTLELFIDDNIGRNNTEDGAIPGIATVNGEQDSLFVSGAWTPLVAEQDYIIWDNKYTGHIYIELTRSLNEGHSLAATFSGNYLELSGSDLVVGQPLQIGLPLGIGNTDLRLKMIRPRRSLESVDETDLTAGIWGPLSNLELKNAYNLGGRNIIPEGFEMRIRRKGTFGGETDPDRLEDDTFLQIMALDLQNNTNQGVEPGSDTRVDANIIDYAQGILFFPDLRPFDPDSSDLCLAPANCGNFGWCRFDPSGNSLLADRPAWPVDSTAYRAGEIYDQTIDSDLIAQFSKYELEVTFLSPVSSIRLNAFNILPGSESVTANNRTLSRDRDYKIDYELGEVEILDAANVTETDDINVSYSYVPFGGGGQKTLAGVSAFVRPDESKWSVSSTWLYSSKGGVPGLEGRRPRLGEEPSRTIVGEFAGQYQTDSWLMTDWVDALPFLDAREPSRIDFEAGLGLSIPNPNTRDLLYIDDFEGAKDVLSVTLNRRAFKAPSIPLKILEEEVFSDSMATERKGELRWYSPRQALQEYDLKPTIDEQEGDDNRQMLEMYFAPRGDSEADRAQSWVGATTTLSRTGADLSRAQFIDIWVNDGIPYEDREDREGTLYLDFGTMSEDAVWYQNDISGDQSTWRVVPPNNVYDTEDASGDGQLDRNSTTNEDIGLDSVPDGSVGDEPFDNFEFDEGEFDEDNYQPRDFFSINGTEGNQQLDSEDLDGNLSPDHLSSYFEFEIDLADETLWETDVRRDFVINDPGQGLTVTPADTSGWRRIRLSLDDEDLVSIFKDPTAVDPVWKKIFHARVWATGFTGEFQRLQIGGIEIIGNRWIAKEISDFRDNALPDSSLAPGEEFLIGVVNNKDDAAIYTPPFTLRKRSEDNTLEREQSITMGFSNFQPGHKASIYRTFPTAQNFSALYEKMQLYLNRRFVSGDADLLFSIRMGTDAASDTTNYYEYRLPVPENWDLLDIDFAELSQLQLEEPDSLSGAVTQYLDDGVVITRKGNPSLNSIRQVVFSVSNVGRAPLREGAVWIDELRLNGVRRNTGLASRADLNVKFSDLLSMNANFSRDGADFLKINDDRGTGVTETRYSVGGDLSLHKFIEGTGINLPVKFGYSKQRRVPKFQTNSDLELTTATDRDITENEDRSLRFSYNRRRSESWTKYVIDPFSASTSYTRKVGLAPTRRDTTTTQTAALNWSLGLREEGRLRLSPAIFFGLFENPELNLLPTGMSASLSGTDVKSTRYSRSDLGKPYERDPNTDRRSGGLSLTAKAQPIKSLSYDISTNRNLNLQKNQVDWLGLNLGREVARNQKLDANYALPVLSRVLSPRINWSGSSNLTLLSQGGTGGTDVDDPEPDRFNAFRNSRTLSLSGRLVPGELKKLIDSLPGIGEADSVATTKSRRSSRSRITLDPVNLTYSIATSTSYSRRIGLPSIFYQLGLDSSPGDQNRAISLAESTTNRTTNYGFDTNVRLPLQMSVKARFSQSNSKSISTTATRSQDRSWPDLDINWGSAHKKLQLERLLRLKQFSASTRYKKSSRESGRGETRVDSATETTSFAPLLNFKATHRSGLTATFNSTKTKSVTDRFLSGRLRTTDDSFRSTFSVKKTLNLRKRVGIPGTSKTRMVTTRMDVNGSLEWSTQVRGTENFSTAPVVTIDSSKLKVSMGTTYNFTDRINGNAQLGFGQDADRKNQARTTRFTELSVTAGFAF